MAEQKNPDEAKSNELSGIGVTDVVVMALCCFTPALAVFLAALGLSSIVGAWMDFILLPALVCFMGLAIFALMPRNEAKSRATAGPS